MNINNVKNAVAFKEVMLNNGYDFEENSERNNIKIRKKDNAGIFIKESEPERFVINIFNNEVNVEDAKLIIKELQKSIDLIDYINFMNK